MRTTDDYLRRCKIVGKGWRTGGVPHFTHERRGVIGGSHVVPPIIGELLKQTPKATGRSGPGRGKPVLKRDRLFLMRPRLRRWASTRRPHRSRSGRRCLNIPRVGQRRRCDIGNVDDAIWVTNYRLSRVPDRVALGRDTAYFGTPEGDETECYLEHEKECIIDPQRIGRVTYEEISAPITTDASP